MSVWPTPDEAGALLREGSGRGVRVAVIDSGVEFSHPGLAGVTVADDVAIVSDGLQLVTRPNNGEDSYGHGTAVAGIIHQSAPDAQIGSFHVLDGTNTTRSAIVCEAVRQALDKGYQIVNCSIGCGVLDQVLDYKEWIDEAYLKGVHIVAACNNFDFTLPEWPGHFGTVITVNMARTPDEGRFWYKPGNLVEFAARGVNVDVLWRGGGVHSMTGSSFAAPRVSGMLARLISARPTLTPPQVKALLRAVADPWSPEIIGPNVTYEA
jgi:subtilisin family serine protease